MFDVCGFVPLGAVPAAAEAKASGLAVDDGEAG